MASSSASTATAGDIKLQNESPEYLTFQDQYANLFEQIQDVTVLTSHLYSARIISSATKRKILSPSCQECDKKVYLLDAVECQIKSDPSSTFNTFLKKLEREQYTKALCKQLKESLAEQCRRIKHSQLSSVLAVAISSKTKHSAITSYSEFLKHCYRNELPDDEKLITTASKHFIELAIINKESFSQREGDELLSICLHGKMDEVLKERTPLLLGDILKCDEGQNMRCVLVEGAPGVGKSTLAWELCHSWDRLATIKPFELVILVQLREKRAQEATKIEDLFPRDSRTNMAELLAILDQNRGREVLLVCDGFDELPNHQRESGSIYIDLIKGKYLQEATLIITSRPSVSARLLKLCQQDIHKRVEVLGFTKDNIKGFSKSVFSGIMLDNFLSYIESNPHFYRLMYIPLNANIVALVFKESYSKRHPFPKTMTQLYTVLVQVLISRHLIHTKQIPSKSGIDLLIPTIESIKKLPGNTGAQLVQLAKTAYEGLLEEKYVFTDLEDDFTHLGMMKKTTSLGVSVGSVCSYSFLHLTLQEYLAALHTTLLQQPHRPLPPFPSSDMNLLYRTVRLDDATENMILKFFTCDINDLRIHPMSFLWSRTLVFIRFLAGLCAHIPDESIIYQKLLYMLRFGFLHRRSEFPLVLIRCAYEYPNIMLDIEEAQEMFQNEKVLCLDSIGMINFDYYALGYCICTFGGKWKVDLYSQEQINLLIKGLQSSSPAIGKIQSLLVYGCCDLSKLKVLLNNFCYLKELRLLHYSPSTDESTLLQQLISRESSLIKLVLGFQDCDKEMIELSIPIVLQPSSLKYLELSVGNMIKITNIIEKYPHLNSLEEFHLHLSKDKIFKPLLF